jgi:preprotein translocase subunit SecG
MTPWVFWVLFSAMFGAGKAYDDTRWGKALAGFSALLFVAFAITMCVMAYMLKGSIN